MKQLRVFGANWCVNCKLLAKQLDRAGIEYVYTDVDQEPDMVKAYGIRSLPTSVIQGGERTVIVTGNSMTDIVKAMKD